MLFDLMFQIMEPSQIITSVTVAVISIVIRQYLPAILAFLARLLVLIFVITIFVFSLFILGSMPPHP